MGQGNSQFGAPQAPLQSTTSDIAPNVNTVNFNPSNVPQQGFGNGKAPATPTQPTAQGPMIPQAPIQQPIGFATEFVGGGREGLRPGQQRPIFDQQGLDAFTGRGANFKFRANPGVKINSNQDTGVQLDPRFIDQSK